MPDSQIPKEAIYTPDESAIQPNEEKADPFEMAKALCAYMDSLKKNKNMQAMRRELGVYFKKFSLVDPLIMQEVLGEALQHALKDMGALRHATKNYFSDLGFLWQKAVNSNLNPSVITHPQTQEAPIITSHPRDKRFRAQEWKDVPYFSFIKQSYLLWDRWVQDIFSNIPGLEPEKQKKVDFYVRQLRDGMAPGNFPWMNPDALNKTLETKGENLLKGIENILRDLEKGQGQLDIQMVDPEAFKVGINLAATPGKVIFQNDIMQLIQYTPATKHVAEYPIVIVPPCINKFYIFDLRRENSFVKWLVDQGFTVFMISWVNPDKELAHKTLDHYVLDGVGQAVEVAKTITQSDQVNAIGFCIGGNFLTCLTGYYAAQQQKSPLASTTYLASLFDFSKAGDLSVFIDKDQLADLENQMNNQGFMDGRTLARTFNFLRANDLVWSYVINNYYLGTTPAAFDFLYWNSDSTNLPAAMYTTYLRKFFLENCLIGPNKLQIKDVTIELENITTPVFLLNTKEDHIAPWQSGYAGIAYFRGPKKFVLGGSGHVVGIFNPPEQNKYGYYVNEHFPVDPEVWLQNAQEKPGSWWMEWLHWIQQFKGRNVKARIPGSAQYPALEDAPGSYVQAAPGNKSQSHGRRKT